MNFREYTKSAYNQTNELGGALKGCSIAGALFVAVIAGAPLHAQDAGSLLRDRQRPVELKFPDRIPDPSIKSSDDPSQVVVTSETTAFISRLVLIPARIQRTLPKEVMVAAFTNAAYLTIGGPAAAVSMSTDIAATLVEIGIGSRALEAENNLRVNDALKYAIIETAAMRDGLLSSDFVIKQATEEFEIAKGSQLGFTPWSIFDRTTDQTVRRIAIINNVQILAARQFAGNDISADLQTYLSKLSPAEVSYANDVMRLLGLRR